MNNHPLPSKGFILLSVTITCAIVFFFWVQALVSFEYESLGHQYYAKKKYKDSAEMFANAGGLYKSSEDKSRVYRSAASAFHGFGDYESSLDFVKLALQYNSSNKAAYVILLDIASRGIYTNYKSLIETLEFIYNLNGAEQIRIVEALKRTMSVIPAQELRRLMKKIDPKILTELYKIINVQYVGRHGDGWSIGKHAGILIHNKDKSNEEVLLQLKTAFPANYYPVTVVVNINDILQNIILSDTSVKELSLKMMPEMNTIWLFIDKSFTPSKLSSSKDNRDLGVNFTIKKMSIL